MTRYAEGAVLLAGLCLFAGCGNPEQSAIDAVAQAEADWTDALAESDPRRRLGAYDSIIDDLESVVENYPETPQGQSLAAGRAIGSMSLTRVKAVRDSLAARAECYASPTVQCLQPFSSRPNDSGAAAAGASNDALAQAQSQVCARGFAAADQMLDAFKINKPVYAQQLIQVALAAAECDKPEEVLAAIDAYRKAEPAVGANRIGAYLGILATEALEPAWASMLTELESTLQSGGLDANTAATLTLTMAVRYAALGDARAAVGKYTYFTETLNYQADAQTELDLAAKLVAAGAADAGLAIAQAGRPNDAAGYAAVALHRATAELGTRLGLLDANATAAPRIYDTATIRDYFAPIAAAESARYLSAAATIEEALDKLVASTDVETIPIGGGGADAAYGVLALVQQKAGAADRAVAALAKAERLRGARAAGVQTATQQYFLPFQILMALAQDRGEDAVRYAQIRLQPYYLELILDAIATSGTAEQALTAAGTLNAASNPRAYTAIIGALIEAGKLDQAEQVINAFAGSAAEKNVLYWQLVTKAANDGDPRRAEQAAERFGLLNGPGERMRLFTTLLNSEDVARDRRRAEPIIREIFSLGEQLDQAGGGSNAFQRNERYLAQEAARAAFQSGFIDLGIELYEAASRKDQRPLFAAFNDKLRTAELTRILMLAHDNLQGEALAYVIDAGIRHLEQPAG
jgi:hypothetical protein